MTSMAIIAGAFPLVISSGTGIGDAAGHGVAVFAGMTGITVFGLFLKRVFYVKRMKRSVAQ